MQGRCHRTIGLPRTSHIVLDIIFCAGRLSFAANAFVFFSLSSNTQGTTLSVHVDTNAGHLVLKTQANGFNDDFEFSELFLS